MPSLKIENIHTDHIGSFSFEIKAGECVCLSGPSGVGKSLLLRALADLDPHQGQMMIDAQSSETMPASVWRKRVGLLPAQSAWWADKVADHFISANNIAYKQLGFSLEVENWSVDRLSSGEKQRLAILRLLSNQPEILLLDEPTANLDPESISKVEDLVKDYQQQHQAAVLWVSHDAKQVDRIADKHWQMSDAKNIQELPVCS